MLNLRKGGKIEGADETDEMDNHPALRAPLLEKGGENI